MKKIYTIAFYFILVMTAFAQEPAKTVVMPNTRNTDRTNTSRYIFSPGTDALLMTVKIWGEVVKPGLYDIPIGTDLIELLSSAGGPTARAKLSRIKIIHASTSEDGGGVTTVDVADFLKNGDSKLIPEIKPNDTIVVPVKPTQYILTSLSWTQQFMSLFSIYSMILYYTSISNK
ncbi:MAG: SLBB domain-containing protein [Candidatus Marinimicrobia bacterium]|nr:SLBB domain-containing protein [Candidatus Neomarinimicrobiota bacterium]